jgi:hypothetical protein
MREQVEEETGDCPQLSGEIKMLAKVSNHLATVVWVTAVMLAAAGCGDKDLPSGPTATSKWSIQTTGVEINAVWGNSGSDVFAVGAYGDILHYNGTAWSTMTSGSGAWLYGVWGSSGSDVFAVRDNGTILHYNGKAWSAMTSNYVNYLHGVWGS